MGFGHGFEADDAGGSFFRRADDLGELLSPIFVDFGNQIGAVVHGELRVKVKDLIEMLIISLMVFAFDGKHGNLMVFDEGGGDIILGG